MESVSFGALLELLEVRSRQLAQEPPTTSWHHTLIQEISKIKRQLQERAEQAAFAAVFEAGR